MDISLKQNDYASRDDLITQLADYVVDVLKRGIADRGQGSLVVSGGSTPGLLFRELSTRPMDWARVTITLADERWVPDNDPSSNAKLVAETFLQGEAAAAKFVNLYTGHATPEEGASQADTDIAAMARPFDLVLLGMGEDGHTASLFPNGDTLDACLDPNGARLVSAMNAPGAPQPRITLTLPALLNAKDIGVLLMGDSKKAVLQQVLSDGSVEDMPIRAVIRQSGTPVQVWWAA